MSNPNVIGIKSIVLAVTMLCLGLGSATAAESAKGSPKLTPEAADFFEQKIRPLLANRCYECHSLESDKSKGGLTLDTRDGLLKGGDNGPIIIPGDPDKSRLITAVRYKDADFQMPPKEMLSEEEIRDLETWVRMGAPDPRRSQIARKGPMTLEEARKFWSFQPPRKTPLPRIKDRRWPKAPIDYFVLTELEQRKIKPAPPADKLVWLRRVTFDLIGLPPTPGEIDAFLGDGSEQAYERVVDRLLDSPHFGERWGRHWLDVARYADSNGLEVNTPYPNAWRYRDYVIKAFNEDKPFDQFIREQIAGDLLPSASQEEQFDNWIATGFLMVGPKMFIEPNRNKLVMDVVDEQIDVTSRAFLGLTVSCARCHDHKFDPIPTKDYYAMAGFFLSTETLAAGGDQNPFGRNNMLVERPLADPQLAEEVEGYQKKLGEVTEALRVARDMKMAFPGNIDSSKLKGMVVDNLAAELVGSWKTSSYSTNFVDKDYIQDGDTDKGKKSVRFVPEFKEEGWFEVQVAYAFRYNRATNVPITTVHADGTNIFRLNQTVPPTIDGIFASIGTYRFAKGTNGSVTISNEGTKGFVVADAVRFIPAQPPMAAMNMMASAPAMKMEAPKMSGSAMVGIDAQMEQLEMDLIKLRENAPPTLPTAMAVREGTPVNARINLRGDPDKLGDEIPRGFLAVLRPREVPRAATATGRLDLANWIADPANPLTARVFVNRVWLHLFGRGIVDTPDNFGALSERPSHPELLDYLAIRFVEEGWSVKKLIRMLVLSSAYGMGTEFNASAYGKDPDNVWLWRMNRRRLDAEVLRDGILAVSGNLDRTAGGPVVGTNDLANITMTMNTQTNSNRRSVYLPVIRNDVLDMFQVFDAADPHVITGKRHQTSAATQALFMMNSPFMYEQSRDWANRLLEAETDEKTRVTRAYVAAYGRSPTSVEVARATRFIRRMETALSNAEEQGTPTTRRSAQAWQIFCHALLAANEFRYLN